MCDLQQSLLAVSLQNTDQEQEMGEKVINRQYGAWYCLS